MRVVIDTNAIISSLMHGERQIAKILQLWKMGKYDLLMSSDLYNEIEQVLCRPKISQLMNKNHVAVFFEALKEDAHWVTPLFRLDIIKDPSDNRILELAHAGHAQYLITGDNHLLDITLYENVTIVRPTTFLTLFDSEDY